MIWIDATKHRCGRCFGIIPISWGVEQKRFEATTYSAAMERAMAWGATEMTFDNGKHFEKVCGEWHRGEDRRSS